MIVEESTKLKKRGEFLLDASLRYVRMTKYEKQPGFFYAEMKDEYGDVVVGGPFREGSRVSEFLFFEAACMAVAPLNYGHAEIASAWEAMERRDMADIEKRRARWN